MSWVFVFLCGDSVVGKHHTDKLQGKNVTLWDWIPEHKTQETVIGSQDICCNEEKFWHTHIFKTWIQLMYVYTYKNKVDNKFYSILF